MSDLNTAIDNLNNASTRTVQTTDFFTKVADGDENTVVTNPVSGVQTPSIKKMVTDVYNAQDVVNQANASKDAAAQSAADAEASANSVSGGSLGFKLWAENEQCLDGEVRRYVQASGEGYIDVRNVSGATVTMGATPIGDPNFKDASNVIADDALKPQRNGKRFGYMPTLIDYGLVGDGVTDDTAAMQALAKKSHLKYDGNGLKYLVTTLPADFSMFKNSCFIFEGIEYPTSDWLPIEYAQVTRTPFYTAWTQNKVCQHRQTIIVPFQLAHGHTYDTTRVAWTLSWDGGSTFTAPEIILDENPTSGRGWNCFSAGVVGDRFAMIVEERNTSTEALEALYLYDRLLSNQWNLNNAIATTSGDSEVIITIPGHSMVAGDNVYFSGVSGAGIAGLSGLRPVTRYINNNTFGVDKGSPADSTNASTGGDFILATSWTAGNYRITSIPTSPDGGAVLTHVHSFTNVGERLDKFVAGWHRGAGQRSVGSLIVSGFLTSPTFSYNLIPQQFADHQSEPSIKYNDADSTYYMTTRNSGQGPSRFGYSSDAISWNFVSFPQFGAGSPLPFEIVDGEAYIFGTERAGDEWNSGAVTYRLQQSRTRSMLLKAPLDDLKSGNFSNLTTTVLGYGRYEGEQTSSGCGVGSSLYYEGQLMYFFGSEDWRMSGRYSVNTPSLDDEFSGYGYQPDIFEYRITLDKSLAGKNKTIMRCPDFQNGGNYRVNNELQDLAPVTHKREHTFRNGINVPSGEIEFARFLRGTNSDYIAMLPNTQSGADNRYSIIAGGGAPSGSRGGMISCYGSNHSTLANDIIFASSTTLAPSGNNITDFGTPNRRVKTPYFVNQPDVSCDRNAKDNIRYVDDIESKEEWDALLNAVRKVKFSLFEYKDSIKNKGGTYDSVEGGARTHAAFIAQDLIGAMKAEGLDPFKYAVLRFEKWEAKPEVLTDFEPAVYDEDGNLIKEEVPAYVISPAIEAGEHYSVVMDEFIILKLAAAGL